jgi:prefoldin beta subunit
MDKALQKKVREFQMHQQELRAIINQKIEIDIRKKEAEAALNAIRQAKADTDVYKQMGRILIKSNIKDVKKTLEQDKELLTLRMNALDKQEKKTREIATKLQKEIQAAIGNKQ